MRLDVVSPRAGPDSGAPLIPLLFLSQAINAVLLRAAPLMRAWRATAVMGPQ